MPFLFSFWNCSACFAETWSNKAICSVKEPFTRSIPATWLPYESVRDSCIESNSLFALAASCSDNVPESKAVLSSVILSICPWRFSLLLSHSSPACFADWIISSTDFRYADIAATAPPTAKDAIPTGDVNAVSNLLQLLAIKLKTCDPPATPSAAIAPCRSPRLSTTLAIDVAKSNIPSSASSGSASE